MDSEKTSLRIKQLREGLKWIAGQGCEAAGEYASCSDLPSNPCITEYCLPCYAAAILMQDDRQPATPETAGVKALASATGSALALTAITAIKTGNPIGTYDAYAEWLASYPQGYLYLKQAISSLAWHLHKTGNLSMMNRAVDEVMGAARELVDEKLNAPNVKLTA
jgi:hypothetical protein